MLKMQVFKGFCLQGAQFFPELPFVLFGSLALLSGALIFITPETLGAALPDTLEQAEHIGDKQFHVKK